MGRKYKPPTSHSIIPDASVSKTYIRQGKERKMKKGKMDVWQKKEGLSFLQCLNYKIEGGNLGIEASVAVGAGVRRIFSVSNVITGREDAIQDHG